MMDNANQHLLNRIDMYRQKINLKTSAAEYQLASVKQRLTVLTHDLYVYAGFLGIPVVLNVIFDIVFPMPSRTILYMVFASARVIISFLYVITLPYNIYHFVKTIILLWLNRESDVPVSLPPLEGTRKGGTAPNEGSYRSEHDKLILVLSRYYINQDKLDQLCQKVKTPHCDMSQVELEYELQQLPVYEDIQPANPNMGAMGERAKGIAKIIMLVIVILVLISLVW